MERGITYETFTRNGVKFNPKNSSFIIPTYNDKGNLNYLYKVIQLPNGKRQILNTPSVDPTLFIDYKHLHKTIWLCEGLWDKMAAEDIIGPARSITAAGFPGSTFKQNWCNILADATVFILGDNDEAGVKIGDMISSKLSQSPQKPKKVHVLRWSEDTPPKFDINDVLKTHKTDAYTFLEKHFIEQESTVISASKSDIVADISCLTFNDLCGACSEVYHFTSDMRMLLHLLITCLYSLKIEGEQLWVRVIGPPGSSKTTIAKIVGASEQTLMRSTFTGLLSGWKDDDPNDASLIPMIKGKALIVKDGDALLQLPNVQQILSQLRDFYDKFISATYLNRVSYEYDNIRSSFIFCGTHSLRNMDNAALGERFLDFELRVAEEDRAAIARCSFETAVKEATTGISVEPAIAAKAKNLIDNIILNYEGVATIHDDDKHAIDVFGNVIAYLRAKVERNRVGEIAYRPLPEVPSRIIKQMVKLFQCAPMIIGKNEPNDEVIHLGKKLTLDIVDTSSYRYKLAHFLSVCPQQSMGQLIEATELPPKIVERELDNMRALEMLAIATQWSSPGVTVRKVSLRPDIEHQIQELNGQ